MTLAELQAMERERILSIARRHGVTIEAGLETSPFFPGGLVADLEEALGRRVDVVEDGGIHPLLRDRIPCRGHFSLSESTSPPSQPKPVTSHCLTCE